MEPKEAIDTLKALCASVEWDFPLDYAAAIDAAIEALEKQIPKKVCIEHAHPKYGYASFCPYCYRMDVRGWSYCPDCGQALKMEGEK